MLPFPEKPTFVMLPQEREVEESQSVQFQCQAVGDPTPTIVWEKEEGQMPQGRYGQTSFSPRHFWSAVESLVECWTLNRERPGSNPLCCRF